MRELSIEYGSDFHYYIPKVKSHGESLWNCDDSVSLFFSGRVALYNLLKFGINKYGWKKVGFPSYYCHEVVQFCESLPIEINYYGYNPETDNRCIDWDDKADNVFINVDFFGFGKIDTGFLKHSVIVDDLTHNVLSIGNSTADYCFGSLRKQLPVPVGGFCKVKKGDLLPHTGETALANKITLDKLTAMWLKNKYLNGAFADKELYRKLFSDAESRFGLPRTCSTLPAIVCAQLENLSAIDLIERTHSNVSFVQSNFLEPNDGRLRLLNKNCNNAMGVVFVADQKALRNRLRSFLIDRKIYPAILWPNQANDIDSSLEDRILFLHADFRYRENDLNFIINTVKEFIQNG